MWCYDQLRAVGVVISGVLFGVVISCVLFGVVISCVLFGVVVIACCLVL